MTTLFGVVHVCAPLTKINGSDGASPSPGTGGDTTRFFVCAQNDSESDAGKLNLTIEIMGYEGGKNPPARIEQPVKTGLLSP